MAEPKKDTKTGKWTIRIRYKNPITNDWETKQYTCDTKKECKQKEVELRARLINSQVIDEVNLIEFYNTWMDTFKRGKVSITRMNKIELVGRNLKTFFGTKQTLRGVNKLNYQKFVNWLGNAKPKGLGLATETVENRHGIVRSMFIEAYDMGYINLNPTRGIKISGQKVVNSKAKTLSFDDLIRVKEEILSFEDTTEKYFLLTQIYTGARYQEVAALTWDDILFEDNQINIDKAYEYTGVKRFKEPKSPAGYRKIDVNEHLMELLKIQKERIDDLVTNKKIRNKFNLVFPNEKDNYPISNPKINGVITEMCDKMKITKVSSHTFRHARTDFLILSGADPIYIKDQLGHEDITTTLKHYAQMNDDLREKNKKILSTYFNDKI